MISALGKFFKNYFNFSGRTRRKDYWLAVIGLAIIETAISLLASVTGNVAPTEIAQGFSVMQPTGIFAIITNIWSLGTLIPGLALTFRRLHDTDKRAWFLLWYLLPIVGALIVFFRYFKKGTTGPNRFGADPKAEIAVQ